LGVGKEILIIRLSSIGDVIHCTPVAKTLKMVWPDCKITWLVSSVSADVIRYNPDIDECWVWSRERFEAYLKSWEIASAIKMWRELKNKLAEKYFDAVLDIHGLFLTGLIALQAKTRRRIGLKEARELNYVFMTETARPLGRHVIDKYLGVLQALDIKKFNYKMTVTLPLTVKSVANDILRAGTIKPDQRFAVLIPGTTWPAKNWPPEYFAVVAKALEQDFKLVLGGGLADVKCGEAIIAKAGVPMLNTIGRTSLLELAAIINQAAVVITGDTGPLHIASALETPVVALFGPTNPLVYGPRQGKFSTLQSESDCLFCHKYNCPKGNAECMKKILPERVILAVYQLTGIDRRNRQNEIDYSKLARHKPSS